MSLRAARGRVCGLEIAGYCQGGALSSVWESDERIQGADGRVRRVDEEDGGQKEGRE